MDGSKHWDDGFFADGFLAEIAHRRRGMRMGHPMAVRGGRHGGPKGRARGPHDHGDPREAQAHPHGRDHEDEFSHEGPGGWGAPPWAALFGGPRGFMFAGRGGRGGPGGRPWGRARRGDVRSAVLVLLTEKPMHGYEIISELAERTEGMWRPSPGSVYPTLQLLEDEGLVVGEADSPGGKRRFSLTDEGRRQAEELAKAPKPWDQFTEGTPAGAREMGQAIRKLMPVIRQVMTTGDERECAEALKVLDDARRKLYRILAGDASEPGEQ